MTKSNQINFSVVTLKLQSLFDYTCRSISKSATIRSINSEILMLKVYLTSVSNYNNKSSNKLPSAWLHKRKINNIAIQCFATLHFYYESSALYIVSLNHKSVIKSDNLF